jgi:hypothetical protein
VGVQEVRWDKGGTVRAGGYCFLLWKKKRKSELNAGKSKYTVMSGVQNTGRIHSIQKLIIAPLKGWKNSNIWGKL